MKTPNLPPLMLMIKRILMISLLKKKNFGDLKLMRTNIKKSIMLIFRPPEKTWRNKELKMRHNMKAS